MQTDLLILQDQDKRLSKSNKDDKGQDRHNLNATKSNDALSPKNPTFLSLLDNIANKKNLPQIENINPLSTNRSERINKKAGLMALENLSDEIKPDIKEKQEESLAYYTESGVGMNVCPDDEATDNHLLVPFGSGAPNGKEGIERTSLTLFPMVSSPERTDPKELQMELTGEQELAAVSLRSTRATGNVDRGSEKSAMDSDDPLIEKDHVLKPELAIRNVAERLDKRMTNSDENRLFSKEVVLEPALSEARKNRSFDELKMGESLDLNKRNLLFKLNSTSQDREDFSDNLSKKFANQESNSTLERSLQNNKAASTKIQKFDSDIFSDEINEIDSDNDRTDDLLSLNSRSSDKISEALLNTKETNPLPKPLQTDVLSQIVKKAVLNFKDGQSEVRIEIKPEFLGQIRMQISTENHQVTAKIMAEIPLVKEIIENNIHQLKSELENHGLEMDKLDVDIFGSQDSDKNSREYERPSFLEMTDETNEDRMESSLPEEKEEAIQVSEERRDTSAIDFFV